MARASTAKRAKRKKRKLAKNIDATVTPIPRKPGQGGKKNEP